MIGTTLISCITGGFSIGLGCGTCCSPAIGVFFIDLYSFTFTKYEKGVYYIF